jgi:4-amino-4-deoxy-L-arabinose transferase-like glycosyltransferase
MLLRLNFWVWVVFLLGLRLLSMAFFPLADTSEPRYAEMARLMVVTDDWITPWFSPGVPFWGKPPFSFWVQALSFKLFGINELAARLPSLLATVGIAGLLYKLANVEFGRRLAQGSVLIFCSGLLVFLTAGAVLTDPFFALATTWAMVAYALAQSQTPPHWCWRYGFFVALALGLLAKGPLVLVLVAGPLLAWLLWSKALGHSLKNMPWASGLVLMLLLSLPWYLLAELKTPGFLNYFLVGEHFLRFIDPGWAGDLYGTAHREPKGMIWVSALGASLPWGVLALAIFFRNLSQTAGRLRLRHSLQDPVRVYLLAWALFAPAFFTFSGNILWTYVLPALPAFSLLVALSLRDGFETNFKIRWALLSLVAAVPLVSSAVLLKGVVQPMTLKTERELIQQAQALMQPGDQLAYWGRLPFSANFYSRGAAQSLNEGALGQTPAGVTLYLAVLKQDWAAVQQVLPPETESVGQNLRYVLVKVRPSRR